MTPTEGPSFVQDDFGRAWPEVLRARMFDQRVVIATGTLDDEFAGRVAAELMTLDASGDDVVRLLLNSTQGTYLGAFAVIDVIDLLGVPVHATCIGRAEGPALGVLAVAARRFVLPHARLRLCDATDAFTGPADEVASWAAQRSADVERFCARVAEAAGRPVSWVLDAMRAGRTFEPHEAIRAGLIDEIARSTAAPVHRISAPAIGFRSRWTPPA
jgi:ATP-dependent Clp protease protease subunit